MTNELSLTLGLAAVASTLLACSFEPRHDDPTGVTADALTCTPTFTPMRGSNAALSPPSRTGTGQFNYVPSVMYDTSVSPPLYRMWWCSDGGGVRDPLSNVTDAGNIYYSQSTSLTSGWSTAVRALTPSHTVGSFDRNDVCDPSVIKGPDGLYYMFYGGNNYSHADQGSGSYNTTKMGVVTSADGVTGWTRRNNGQPIVEPRLKESIRYAGSCQGGCGAGWQCDTHLNQCFQYRYGAGEPSVFYIPVINQWFMAYVDDTGAVDGSHMDMSATYFITSNSWLFGAHGSTGYTFPHDGPNVIWNAYAGSTPPNTHMAIEGNDQDWMYSMDTGRFIMISARSPARGSMTVDFWDGTYKYLGGVTKAGGCSSINPGSCNGDFPMASGSSANIQGPGLVRDQHGLALPARSGAVPMDFFDGYGDVGATASWRLAHWGWDQNIACP